MLEQRNVADEGYTTFELWAERNNLTDLHTKEVAKLAWNAAIETAAEFFADHEGIDYNLQDHFWVKP